MKIQLQTSLVAVVLSAIFGSNSASAAINRFDDHLVTIKPYVETASYGYELKNNTTSTDVRWNPNEVFTEGAEIFINGLIGIGISGRGAFNSQDVVNKGNTDYQDWRFSFAYPSFLVSLNYGRFQGFYVDNSSDIDPTVNPNGPLIQAPNMVVENMGGSFTWIAHPENFSLEAAMDQTVRQEESGGSWLAGVLVTQTSYSNDQPLVPSQVRSQYGVDQNVQSASFTSILARLGYGYTVVLAQKWFATADLLLGLVPHIATYSDAISKRQYSTGVANGSFLVSMGFNGDSWIFAARVTADTVADRTDSLQISSNLFALHLTAGLRF